MSTYIYTFINGKNEIESEGVNLWDGAKKVDIHIVRADKLSNSYLNSTPFDRRERTVWAVGEYGGTDCWTVKQRKKN